MLSKQESTVIYAVACVFYLAFSFLTFPVFDVPVFGFTIPLAMLGGWLYRYRGAIITTFLVIPYNFCVLYFYIDEPELIAPMATGAVFTTLLFSMGTAHLRLKQEQVLQLNASLEHKITERTADLRQLAEYLIEAEEEEKHAATISLLKRPLQCLADMQDTSRRLVAYFEETKHADLQPARKLDVLIRATANHLANLDNTSSLPSTDIRQAVNALISKFSAISQARIEMVASDLWSRLGVAITYHLHQILHEALTNAVRHGNASRITIGIEEEAEASITVFIQNDGASIPDQIQEGMGLALMRYHASKIGASLSVDGGPGKDTIIRCRLH